MIHSFDTGIATRLGVSEAVIVSNIAYWVKKNQANDVHLYDGYYWTYNSAKAFAELFPYWSEKQVYRLIKKLEDAEIIASGNYNKAGYDRTKWYTIIDKSISRIYEIHFPNSGDGIPETVQPIPDSKPIVNPDSKLNKEIIDEIYKSYPSRCVTQNRSTGKSRVRDLAGIRRSIKKHELTPEQMLEAVNQYVADCKKNKTYMMNFATFLNGIPDESTEETPFLHEAKLIVESGNIFSGNIKNVYSQIVGESHSSLMNEYKRTLEAGERGSEEHFNEWCIQKIKARYKL